MLDFDNVQIRLLFSSGIAMLLLTWSAFLARCYVKLCMIKSWHWDDTILSITQLMATIIFILAIIFTTTPIITFKDVQFHIVLFQIGQPLYVLCVILLKLALGILFLRIVTAKWQRWTIHVSLVFMTVIGLGFLAIAIGYCGDPRQYLLNAARDKCMPWHISGSVAYIYAACDTLTNWLFVAMPVSVVYHAMMPRRQKFSVCALLALGAASSLVSVFRFPYIHEVRLGSGSLSGERRDLPGIPIAITSGLEIGLALMATSGSALRPLFRSMAEKGLLPHRSKRSNPGGQGRSLEWTDVVAKGRSRQGNTLGVKGTIEDKTPESEDGITVETGISITRSHVMSAEYDAELGLRSPALVKK